MCHIILTYELVFLVWEIILCMGARVVGEGHNQEVKVKKIF
jgi:hypothetical protein